MIDNKGHPHAELAIQYWTEAKDDSEAWRNWEFMAKDNDKWVRLTTHPSFRPENQYRRKPKTKLIHGFEVPDISFVPEAGDSYYAPDPFGDELWCICVFATGFLAMRCANFKACYPPTPEGEQAAIKHALAMLGFDSVEEMEAALAAKEGGK